MSQGFPGNPFEQAIAGLRADFRRELNQYAGGVRREVADRLSETDKRLSDLATIAQALSVDRSGGAGFSPGIVRIEDIPGQRIAYDLTVDIPIDNNTTSRQEQSTTVTMDGPFVAVMRYAAFRSTYEFQQLVSGTTTRFNGRSFGRYRPIHSAWDLYDAANNAIVTTANPIPTNATPSVVAYPSAQAGFRTMEFDGLIEVVNQGSGRPRQRIQIPTSMWQSEISTPQQLPCLDFFERGEVLTFKVEPTHVNNPAAGNVAGNQIFNATNGQYPFLDGQFDPHEGIATTAAWTFGGSPTARTGITTDIITRLPNGVFTIGYFGYRIFQTPGVAR